MKLDPVKLEDVSQRIRSAGNAGFCVLLAMPATTKQVSSNLADSQDPLKQNQRPLRNLISYLRTKDSAGVVLLNPLTQEIRHDPASGKLNNPEEAAPDPAVTGVLHAFPPCDFSFDLLAQRATRLQKEYAKDNHLVILLIRSCGSL
ncbi:unnamed protein product [Protopolystoma xenopodis]|uniref:SPOC domain-containing protein n=1 Tax=Protopolystoma xenopodis TaxID=117903 RepID=A0A448XT90_9PLAT|nr:unnamed protein product [Protopolystoma xenopodis]